MYSYPVSKIPYSHISLRCAQPSASLSLCDVTSHCFSLQHRYNYDQQCSFYDFIYCRSFTCNLFHNYFTFSTLHVFIRTLIIFLLRPKRRNFVNIIIFKSCNNLCTISGNRVLSRMLSLNAIFLIFVSCRFRLLFTFAYCYLVHANCIFDHFV